MKGLTGIFLMFLMVGCGNNDLSWISICNQTEVSIYAQPYSSEFANSDWIEPGGSDDFYSINCDCLDGFEYFSFYYDSLIVILMDHENEPIKFYKDGTTINYDPTLNPFMNPEVWKIREFDRYLTNSESESTNQEKHISEHYFSISQENIKSISDTIFQELNPAF
jgi:hypothetical protein